MNDKIEPKPEMIATGDATAILPIPHSTAKPITVIGTERIRDGFDANALKQALNARTAPGVTDLVLNPDAHSGYGAPVGCVLVSPSHVYPGPVGVDIKCSMSLLQLDLPAPAVVDRRVRRALIDAIGERTPTGPGRGQRSVKKGRIVDRNNGMLAVTEGASQPVCEALGIPPEWAAHCEDAAHRGHDNTTDALHERLNGLVYAKAFDFDDKLRQLGSYGGGNHFGECNIVSIGEDKHARETAEVFGLKDNCVSFLSHCGSRGFGFQLAKGQFRAMLEQFEAKNIELPGGDREMVYAELGTPEADAYLDDMALGANFATANHLLINALVLEAFQEIFPGVKGNLVYFISHNIARQEMVGKELCWVHRKGATRAFPAHHPGLAGTLFASSGHPILLPGNPKAGSVVMVATPDAAKSCFSVNHGAGRAMGRKAAARTLIQREVDAELDAHDILSNCRTYPIDEAPAAYKDFREVLKSVEQAGLAKVVATLKARFVIKDGDTSTGGAA